VPLLARCDQRRAARLRLGRPGLMSHRVERFENITRTNCRAPRRGEQIWPAGGNEWSDMRPAMKRLSLPGGTASGVSPDEVKVTAISTIGCCRGREHVQL